ncbi:hypothetical protein FACS189413_02580 [Bacteroidia bacterium]|nr:hypothetical protein FACS189413_02580 [Bacteroidia bacterium]
MLLILSLILFCLISNNSFDMKNITKKLTSILLLLGMAIPSFAVDIYLSSSGDDYNDGLTPELAVATLQTAYNLIPANNNGGHIIHVSGFINIPAEVNMTNTNQTVPGTNDGGKFLTIDGGDSITSGFDGGNATRLINLQGNTGAITFKNLTFRNARGEGSIRMVNTGVGANQLKTFEKCHFYNNTSTANSSILHIYRCNAIVDDCEFDNNTGSNRGGAIFIGADAIATVKNSRIHDNKATNGNGGAIYADGNGKLTLQSTRIENHDISTVNNSDGGAIYLANPNGMTIENCIIRNNKVKRNGGAICINPSNNPDNTVVIKNTLIANNETTGNSGGGISINNAAAGYSVDVSIINSTIFGNKTTQHGGGLFATGAQPGSSLRFINCTVTDNESTNNNGGFGAGVSVRSADQNIATYIYNSIFESNFASVGGTTKIYSDFWFSGGSITPQGLIDTNVFLHNSIIGTNVGNLTGSTAGNLINSGTAGAGLAIPHADYIASQNSVPLDFDSESLEFGNAQYLQDLGINTDQLGNVRAFANGKCAAGAVEIPADFVVTNPDPHDYQHFIIYGQSLSVGYQAYQSLSLTNVPGNYMIGSQVWANYGNTALNVLNPLVSTSVTNSAAIAECPVTTAVNHIRLKQALESPEIDNRFIATSVGMGGKTVDELSKGNASNLYNTYKSALKSAYGIAVRSGSTINCPAIFWMQGENDYTVAVTPKDEYRDALVQLKSDMQNDVVTKYGQAESPLFYTYQVGAQYTRGESQAGMAQLEASNELDDMICVGPVYPVTDVGGHLDANGYRWYGEMIGKVYYKTKVLGEDFKPLQPKVLSRDASDAKKIRIQYIVPKLPLVFDTNTLKEVNNYGFVVYHNGSKQTISSVEIVDDTVILTCAANLTGEITVEYAGTNATGGNGRGHGNLRDSDDEKGFFNYIDPNLKNENEEYVYPHYDTLASYTPASGEPKDTDGNVIYNQPYPLYNFSAAFYYTIPSGEAKLEVPSLKKDVPTGINIPKSNGKIVAVQYYNLVGARRALPSQPGVYIVKKIYESGNSEVSKTIINK